MKKFWDIFRLAGNHKPQLWGSLIFNLLNAVFSVFTFAALVPILQVIFRTKGAQVSPPSTTDTFSFRYWYEHMTHSLDQYANDEGRLNALILVCVITVVLAFFKNIFNYLALRNVAVIRTGVSYALRRQLYDKLLGLSLGYFTNERKGDLMSRMNNDLMEIEFSVMGSLVVLFKSPIMMLVYLVTMFGISWKLTLFALIFMPISGFLISRIAKVLKHASKRGKGQLSDLMNVLEESLSGMRIVQAFNAQDAFRGRFEHHNRNYLEVMTRLYKREFLGSPMSEFISIVVIAILLGIGGALIFSNDSWMDGELFLGYLVIFSQIIQPARALSDGILRLNKGAASIERINEILHAESEVKEAKSALPLPDFTRDIHFENVAFSYTDKKVVDGASFVLKKGETVALVGPSGGGKSTLANLLARFYDVDSGAISIDGTNIRDVSLHDLRHQLGVVSQDSILFNDSVAANIALGQTPDLERVKQAAHIANAAEFIEKLDGTYSFNVGDGGNKLSGGQKQRLSIARAVYANPPILILDEATSALDTESEQLVQAAIAELMKGRTSLVIAHRLSTIRQADQILVIDGGRITQRGTHDELMAAGGMYKRLVEMQAFD